MRQLSIIFALITLSSYISCAEIEKTAYKTKDSNVTNAEKIVAPGLLLSKAEEPVVAEIETAQNSKATQNSETETKHIQLENKDAVKKNNNSTETAKVEEKNENKDAVKMHKPTGIVKTEEKNEMQEPHPSIGVEKLPTTTAPAQESDVDQQYQYQQALKNIDLDIEGSVRTGFYILVGISIGALMFIGFKLNNRLSRAERKYGVQGNRSNQELAPLPLSMEDPESDEEDQTLFDINRQQIRIF